MKLNRREVLAGIATTPIIGAGATALYGWARADNYQFPKHEIKMPDLPAELEGFSVIHVSDTHFDTGSVTVKRLEKLMTGIRRAVDQIDKGIMVFTGDFISQKDTDYAALQESLAAFSGLDIPKYGVLGNHENSHPHRAQIIELIKSAGINILDEAKPTAVEVSGVNVMGLPDFTTNRKQYDSGAVADFVETESNDTLNLLLTHDADGVCNLMPSLPKSVLLSGHTHGGQVNVPTLRWFPRRHIKYQSEFWEDLSKVGDSSYISVSRGVGHSYGLPFRINADPEVPVYVFKREDES